MPVIRFMRKNISRTPGHLWEYRCPILNVEQTSIFEKLIYKLHVVFVGREEGHELAGYLYVPARMLNGYVPQTGDDIQGMLWMTGF
jgi:hypothetical protein